VARCIVALSPYSRTESAEVTIKDVVEAIAGAMDFKGKIVVGHASYVFARTVPYAMLLCAVVRFDQG